MWFHHVSQTPGDGGYTIAVNYCKSFSFTSTLCLSLGGIFSTLQPLISYIYASNLQGMTCNSTSSMLISTSCNQYHTSHLHSIRLCLGEKTKIRNPVIQRYEEMKQHLLVAIKFLSLSGKPGEDLNITFK